jgi:hypothetical protein
VELPDLLKEPIERELPSVADVRTLIFPPRIARPSTLNELPHLSQEERDIALPKKDESITERLHPTPR